MAENKRSPLGIKIISIIYLLIGLLYLVSSYLPFFNPGILSNIPNFSNYVSLLGNKAYIILGIVFIVFSLIFFTIAYGIFRLKKWARMIAVAISLFMIFGGILSILEKSYISIANIFFNVIIVLYLLINKKVRLAFSKKNNDSKK